ncbi:MAG TPA: aminodeoxychorismate synthase component I [Terriglobia bacterium]|nr:aminodeoxychorismate synthase component I [Terriglobia bacterium]
MIPFPSKYYETLTTLADSVLLETSRPDVDNRRSYLFVNPTRVLRVETLDEVPRLFQLIEECLEDGRYVAGYMGYECGYHFEPRAATHPPARSRLPLAWFGVYEQPFIFDHGTGTFEPDRPQPGQESSAPGVRATDSPPVSRFRLAITQDEYCAKVEAIKKYLAAGDTYQVNLTTRASFKYSGSPAALFSTLRSQQKVPYAALIHAGNRHILSFSPELFFRLKDGRITTRPMKGTAPRGHHLAQDAEIRNWLREDPKNRSENVMIVDMERNDLGKIARPGSLRVDELFAVETYETLFQMTSTVSGTLRPGTTLYDLFRAIFPSGSVTGAPKCRTMQIIQETEDSPRGVYTGAIGYFSPSRDAVFSVPIRTMVLDGAAGEIGVGSGIVFDSLPLQEYEECLLKMQFLTRSRPAFRLLESLRWDGEYQFLQQHLERLRSSAEYFDFPLNEPQVVSVLENHQKCLRADQAYKIRLLVDIAGQIEIDHAPLDLAPESETVILSPVQTSSQDKFLYHKTTCRDLYEHWHAEARRQGHADVLFTNEKGEITEGANNNIFAEVAGSLFTPPVECGLLPGVYRRDLLERESRASEHTLTLRDLRTADAIYLCNSVRGLRRVRLAEAHDESVC